MLELTTSKRTTDHTDYLIINLGTIIALASMTYIANLDAYECHLGSEKALNDFIDER